jgi:hypothetical protein
MNMAAEVLFPCTQQAELLVSAVDFFATTTT